MPDWIFNEVNGNGTCASVTQHEVTAVMPRTGNLQISLRRSVVKHATDGSNVCCLGRQRAVLTYGRPGYWLSPAEQQTILRPLLQPARSRSASAAGQNAAA